MSVCEQPDMHDVDCIGPCAPNNALCVCGHVRGWHHDPGDFTDDLVGECDARSDANVLVKLGCTCTKFRRSS